MNTKGKHLQHVEDSVSAMLSIKYFIGTIWNGARLRTKRRKCIVSGCEIPARAEIGSKVIAQPWLACGVHRKPLADMLNAAGNEYVKLVSQAHREMYCAVINGLDKLGNHEDELGRWLSGRRADGGWIRRHRNSLSIDLGRLTAWASTDVRWGNYDKGWFKREFVKQGGRARWCYSFWYGSWGVTFHWYVAACEEKT